jgi:iron complex transport system ATP-binding protein
MNSPFLITVEALEFAYDGHGEPVLEGLDLQLAPGSVTAILGPNGAGKTTLLYLLLGLLRPAAGSIRIDGREVAALSRGELSRAMALVPQTETSAFDFSVLDYVLMGRAPHLGMLRLPSADDLRVALARLSSLNLMGLRRRSILELSAGERQMVILARALTQEPKVLLLDEPTAHLDLANSHRVLTTLSRLAADGMTVAFATHDPAAAIQIADQIVLLRQGRALAKGPPTEVLTADLLQATYGIPVRVINLEGRPFVLPGP